MSLKTKLMGVTPPELEFLWGKVEKKRGRKKSKPKACPTTLKEAKKASTLRTIIIAMVSSVLTVMFMITWLDKTGKYDIISNVEHKINILLYEKKLVAIEQGVWKLLKKYKSTYAFWKRMNNKEKEHYVSAVYIAKTLRKMDDQWFMSNTIAESFLNKRAKSEAGACGVNQVMPYNFRNYNRHALYKYGNVDIFNVKHNTEAAIEVWIDNREQFKYRMGRYPTGKELAMCYNGGINAVCKALKHKEWWRYLGQETVRHGVRVEYFYKCLEAKDYTFPDYHKYYLSYDKYFDHRGKPKKVIEKPKDDKDKKSWWSFMTFWKKTT